MEKEKKVDKITLYMLLGVNEKATEKEIRKAYKKMVYIVHPDKNPNDPNATEKFRNLQIAYKILMDSEKRALYDETYFPSLRRGCRFRLELRVIIRVGERRSGAEPESVFCLRNKERMAAEIFNLNHLADKHGAGVFIKIKSSVLILGQVISLKFINIPAGVHTESFNQLISAGALENTEIEKTAVFYHFTGEI